jgi:hypothetical protein
MLNTLTDQQQAYCRNMRSSSNKLAVWHCVNDDRDVRLGNSYIGKLCCCLDDVPHRQHALYLLLSNSASAMKPALQLD